ncbi:MAG: hypothetical protein ACT4PV_07285 [Planctomycetaceae bacterium]
MPARLLLAAFCCACAASRPVLEVPESPLQLSPAPPPREAPPDSGPSDAAEARRIDLLVACGPEAVTLSGWCRVGVWTTLEQTRAEPFVVRESWGRLGVRAPRLLARLTDDLISGAVARLRPEAGGALTFRIEVAQGRIDAPAPCGTFEGRTILLPRPRRHGYRFSGTVPPRHAGRIAVWSPGVEVFLLGPGEETASILQFEATGGVGLVAGEASGAEAFLEEWRPLPPQWIDAEGVRRGDFRLERRRSAAGFRPGPGGAPESYGGAQAAFRFARSPG